MTSDAATSNRHELALQLFDCLQAHTEKAGQTIAPDSRLSLSSVCQAASAAAGEIREAGGDSAAIESDPAMRLLMAVLGHQMDVKYVDRHYDAMTVECQSRASEIQAARAGGASIEDQAPRRWADADMAQSASNLVGLCNALKRYGETLSAAGCEPYLDSALRMIAYQTAHLSRTLYIDKAAVLELRNDCLSVLTARQARACISEIDVKIASPAP